MKLARRTADVAPFQVMAILARAQALSRQGRDIIHLEIGEPDFPTPEPIVAAGMAALRAGLTHYTPALGLPALREAIADDYAHRYGVAVPPGRVCVTPGASGALLLAMATLFDPEDEILMADPGYPCNRQFARLIEARPVAIPVGEPEGFQLTAAQVARHWGPRTRGVLVANPSNPTGSLMSADTLREIYTVVRERGGWMLVDEIYHALVYDAQPPSAAGLAEDVVVINSFSKYFQMTGWRLGWVLLPALAVPAAERLAQNLFLAPPTVAQHAALAAFSASTQQIIEARKAEFNARRDSLIPASRDMGFVIRGAPTGAFYLYADIRGVPGAEGMDGQVFADRLLEDAGVALTPGQDFGQHEAEHHVRLAYTTSQARLQEAVQRMRRCLK